MSGQKVGKFGENDADLAVAFLRRLYPTKTTQSVAADTGIPADTVRKWFDGATKPSFVHFARLICAYGPDFLAAVLPERLGWLDAAARAEERARLQSALVDLQKRLERTQ